MMIQFRYITYFFALGLEKVDSSIYNIIINGCS